MVVKHNRQNSIQKFLYEKFLYEKFLYPYKIPY